MFLVHLVPHTLGDELMTRRTVHVCVLVAGVHVPVQWCRKSEGKSRKSAKRDRYDLCSYGLLAPVLASIPWDVVHMPCGGLRSQMC